MFASERDELVCVCSRCKNDIEIVKWWLCITRYSLQDRVSDVLNELYE
jgi:hypothetical protein